MGSRDSKVVPHPAIKPGPAEHHRKKAGARVAAVKSKRWSVLLPGNRVPTIWETYNLVTEEEFLSLWDAYDKATLGMVRPSWTRPSVVVPADEVGNGRHLLHKSDEDIVLRESRRGDLISRVAQKSLARTAGRPPDLGPEAQVPSEADLRIGDYVVVSLPRGGVDWGRVIASMDGEPRVRWRFAQFTGSCTDDTVYRVIKMPSEIAAEELAEQLESLD